MLWSVFDELVSAMASDAEKLLAARRTYSQKTGTVEPDHELYAERSDAFVEWFLFELRDEEGLTSVERRICELPSEDVHMPHLLALRASYRSLFQVVRQQPGGLLLDDLVGGGRFSVDERRRLPGVSAGDLFEARLIPDPDRRPALCFGRALQFHPREAADSVLAQIRLAKQNAEPKAELLSRLARLRLRCFSYRHVPAARIYAPFAG
ncbi:MAG TPA: hypothetical protein PKI49_08050 [Pseudomonadota bacterium]|jgi:hypothetical protein|nr:hypothetical protein [Pseudomonadota bacterium]HNI59200.1 hypothetical protein [Pseudomonadota bacterium]HNK46940.1 hypothetical protein [Pseudomonadota bacterium]HNN54098.1 hypothetical protein [Pseudomonadota bacterium]HNO68448.1 hypothetical protein [Pseudomonadota bacterium]